VTEPERKHVLFVDDEQEILDGLRDALRGQRSIWRMSFAPDAQRALEIMEESPADVVVSDMRMPVTDGAALLAQVQALHPAAVRIVLSGYADTVALTRAGAVAHRFLAKPAETEDIVRVVERSFALRDLSRQITSDRDSAALSSLPSAPTAYLELTRALGNERLGTADVGKIVAQDVAMSAKVLQLANSAFFGTGRTINQLPEAVTRIGVNNLRSLALSVGAFESFRPRGPLAGFSIAELQHHSTLVARIARRIAPKGMGDDAFTAGMLHDVGVLVLASKKPEQLAAAIENARAEGIPVHNAERDAYGATHAEIGAHLLDLWGIPHPIVEAVAYHHEPANAAGRLFDQVTAVHVADRLAHDVSPHDGDTPWFGGTIDEEYLESLGAVEEMDRWREIALEEVSAGEDLGDQRAVRRAA